MNYREMLFILGEIALIFAGILLIPLFVALGLGESTTYHAFGVAIVTSILVGIVGFACRPPKDKREMKPSSAIVLCGLTWILIALIGAIPYRLSGSVNHYIDALFETVSGVTTTGATVIANVEILPKSILLWRSLSQWIGGMGVLVFVIAVLPKNESAATQLAKAEMPGPQFEKLVSKLRFTAQILYVIYIVMTLVQAGLLVAVKMPVFDSFCHAFTTASTGGFSVKNASIGAYNNVGAEIIITIFSLLFSVNFNVYYLVLIGQARKALKNEETWWMFGIYILATFAATMSLFLTSINEYGFAESLRYASFQVATVMSTTGYVVTDFGGWPVFSQFVLITLMFIGGSAGSTAGGIKVSRIAILSKSSFLNIRKTISPRSVRTIKMDGKPLGEEVVSTVQRFMIMYIFIFVLSYLAISFYSPFQGSNGLVTNLSAVATCLNNVGCGIMSLHNGLFVDFNYFSKIVLSLDMLLGRLELLPIILIFAPRIWRPVKFNTAK